MNEHEPFSLVLKPALASYALLTDETFEAICKIAKVTTVSKHAVIYRAAELPESFAFGVKG
ncbi:hypothetical protein [Alteromonas sp. ASW11-130]|uniref:hypothetical protein n=1 Tax=Alteromonas sp. ASW11-130 TaxID=3015775 RepID=UPI002242BB37|nr:hypothetical protein [Alteromonas sp. ASW11-130]MCW8093188.1 hypothetical protein [Alteromonas sp. ASW11-130]